MFYGGILEYTISSNNLGNNLVREEVLSSFCRWENWVFLLYQGYFEPLLSFQSFREVYCWMDKRMCLGAPALSGHVLGVSELCLHPMDIIFEDGKRFLVSFWGKKSIHDFYIFNSRNPGTEHIVIICFLIRWGSHRCWQQSLGPKWQLGLKSKAVWLTKPRPLSLSPFQGSRNRLGECQGGRRLKRRGKVFTLPSSPVSSLLEKWAVTLLPQKKKRRKKLLGLWESFCSGDSQYLVQLEVLCDLTGAADAESFVEGPCVHLYYAQDQLQSPY